MPSESFKQWLAKKSYSENTRNTYLGDLSRLEKHYGDLDQAYDADGFASLRNQLAYSKDDERAGRPNPAKFVIDGNLYSNLGSYKAKLAVYERFRKDQSNGILQRTTPRGDALEELKQKFLKRFPDFERHRFQAKEGEYWREERQYKEEVMAKAAQVLNVSAAPPILDTTSIARGRHMLAVLQKPPANFVGWRTFSQIEDAGPDAARQIAELLGELVVEVGDVVDLVGSYASKLEPLLKLGTQGASALSQTRTLLTAALALVRPEEAIVIKTQIMQRAGRLLLGRPLFRATVIGAAEYRDLLNLSEAIFAVMRDEWRWEPKDLWDVQGFLWVTDERYRGGEAFERDEEEELPVASQEQASPPSHPLNLILYGPPGTGKTYTTVSKAVEICDGLLPSTDRATVLRRYQELIERKRIEFVTFHQSYAYEDFVEGIRPKTESEDEETLSRGIAVHLQPGVFRQIAAAAAGNRGKPVAATSLDRTKQVFKMSLGRSGEDEGVRLFDEAIKGGYVVLGWGGDVDWSDAKYASFSNIKVRWQEDYQDATGNDSNIKQIFTLRAAMNVGDLVIVSDGNRKFRAIGEVTGPYKFVPNELGHYNHRRPVRWLWHSDESQPRELIYNKEFTQVSAYQLRPSMVNWPALEQFVGGAGEAKHTGAPEPYVLIIDEINRANISKVFGELITLLEPDKRLGADNALTVALPYSGDRFGVPSNLHVIGTMNTADRSIALLDTALRRRFEFLELMPEPEVLQTASDRSGIDLVGVLVGLNQRIEYLFDREHQIGHAFFISCQTPHDVDRVMRTKVIPLLAEYFYDNWEKVRQVLGETTDDGAFIRRRKLQRPAGNGALEIDEERWRYEVQPSFSASGYEQLKG